MITKLPDELRPFRKPSENYGGMGRMHRYNSSYGSPRVVIHTYMDGSCFLHVGSSLFVVEREDVLRALVSGEWYRA